MPRNTGAFFGENFIRGWKKSFDIKGRTNYADYSSFLGWNFFLVIAIFYCSWNFVPKPYYYVLTYLIADLFPMLAIAIRRLNDTGSSLRKLAWILVPFYGWWKLRAQLNKPSLYEQSSTLGMKKREKYIAKFLLDYAPWTVYKLPENIIKSIFIVLKSNWLGTIIMLLLIPFPLPPFGFVPTGLVIIVLAILAPIVIQSVTNISEIAAVQAALITGISECYARQEEKKTTYFSDVDAFSGQFINFKIVKSSTSKSSETCFTARAVPTKKIDEHTWFEIKSDPKGKKTTKTCGDPKKFCCYEGGKWSAPEADETPSEERENSF